MRDFLSIKPALLKRLPSPGFEIKSARLQSRIYTPVSADCSWDVGNQESLGRVLEKMRNFQRYSVDATHDG
jgi:hypothetical protein